MRKLRRAQQRCARHRSRFRYGAVAAGAAAAMTLATGISPAKPVPMGDLHELLIKPDADGDLLADREESAIGYRWFDRDQNHNGTRDGVELAKRCATVINGLPWKDDVISPVQTYKWCLFQKGLETCEICGETVNMGPAGIVNPQREIEVDCPLIAIHYMEHGSFSYRGDLRNGRLDLQKLLRAIGLRFPNDPNEHQLVITEGDSDLDLLTDNEEMAGAFDLLDADQNENITPDGIDLAKQCAEVIEALPIHEPNAPGIKEVYKASFMQRGIELCEVCGKWVNMGYWRVINPKSDLSIELPVIVCHYMEHGSFSYSGSLHGKGRVDVPRLADVLEMPRRCGDLGTLYLPGDLNENCVVNLADLGEWADQWLGCTDPNEGQCPK